MTTIDRPDGSIVREADFEAPVLRQIRLICDRYGLNYSDPEGFGDAISSAIGIVADALEQISVGSRHKLLIEFDDDRPRRIYEIPR
jgi:hypothetical protein